MCTAVGCFRMQEVDLFALKFYLDRVVSVIHTWRQKTRDTGLPDGEDCIHLRSLILTQYRIVKDRRTDRQTDGFAVAYTSLAKLCFAKLCKTYGL